jgi:hypothetical protein
MEPVIAVCLLAVQEARHAPVPGWVTESVGGISPDWGKMVNSLAYFSPFAPSDFNCLNFKLPVESNSQAQPLENIFL